MKNKLLIMAVFVCMTIGLTACGKKDDVNVIVRDTSEENQELSQEQKEGETQNASGSEEGNLQDSSENKDEESGGNSSEEKGKENVLQTGMSEYIFMADGISGTVPVTTDIDSAPVIKALGEPESYFEAPSCAFQGIDKIYTYEHFEINTYQEGNKDKISMILFKDDLASTSEGVYIGMTKDDMESAYGTGYENINESYIYKKDNMKLVFIISDGAISSIEYVSMKLD